jgi:predicted nucleotidyltransferase
MSVGTVVPAVVVPPAAAGSKDVDLYAVVERVRTLMLENEELGDMVAEAGAADGDQWVQTLEDTKAVIASLE